MSAPSDSVFNITLGGDFKNQQLSGSCAITLPDNSTIVRSVAESNPLFIAAVRALIAEVYDTWYASQNQPGDTPEVAP
jgi:hypothetical protein